MPMRRLNEEQAATKVVLAKEPIKETLGTLVGLSPATPP